MVRRYFTRTSQGRSAATLEAQAFAKLQRQSDALITQYARQITQELTRQLTEELSRQPKIDLGSLQNPTVGVAYTVPDNYNGTADSGIDKAITQPYPIEGQNELFGRGSDAEISAAYARLFFNTLDYFTSRPRTKTSAQESQRSVNANNEFRLSHSQMLVEAAQTLQTGDKNR